MKNSATRAATAAVAALATTLILSSCSDSAGSGTDGSSPDTFTVGVFGPDVTFASFYSAIGDNGALAEELDSQGIELKIQTIPSGSNLVAALAGGSVDAAIVPGSAVVGVTAQGGEMVPLMNMFDGPSQQIIARSELQTSHGDDVSTFADARWAFTRVGSISEISAKLEAEAAGLTWDDLKRLPLGSGSETQAMLESDRADILSTSPNNAAEAVVSGEAYLVANPQADESSPIAHQLNAVFAASPEFAEKNPDLTQDVVTALVSALSTLADAETPDDALETMSDDFTAAVGDSWAQQWEYSTTGFSRATGGFSPDEVAQTVEGAAMVAMVDKSYEAPTDLFDNTWVVAAYEELELPVPAGLS